mmetsp:Transcript_23132/g.72070  ORF Transcript_23132/g.72070 Transcript_23132/m.72070 type:complete len:218 (-) Transcript_23132:131-784(-)
MVHPHAVAHGARLTAGFGVALALDEDLVRLRVVVPVAEVQQPRRRVVELRSVAVEEPPQEASAKLHARRVAGGARGRHDAAQVPRDGCRTRAAVQRILQLRQLRLVHEAQVRVQVRLVVRIHLRVALPVGRPRGGGGVHLRVVRELRGLVGEPVLVLLELAAKPLDLRHARHALLLLDPRLLLRLALLLLEPQPLRLRRGRRLGLLLEAALLLELGL